MRIIKYYEHSVNTGEAVPLRVSELEKIIADRVCDLLNIVYPEYGSTIVEIEFRRVDVQYVYCNRRREATFALALHRKDSIIDDIFVTINYNTNELISIESNVGPAFNRSLFKTLSFKLTENEKEKKGVIKYSAYDLRDKVKEIVHSIFDVYDIKEFKGCNARCTICEGGVIRFNGTYKIFAALDGGINFLSPLDGFVTVTFDVIDNTVANIGVTTTFLSDIASCYMAEEIKGQLNEWLKEADKPKIWTSTANVYIDPAIREIHERFMKNEREAIWDAYIPDTIKRYIENDPVIMSKNYISEEEKGMITPNFVRHSQSIDGCIKTLMNKFYCYRTANVIYCSSHAEHAKEQDTVRCSFKVYCTQNENDGPMLQNIYIRCCPYCDDIHILDVEVESTNCLEWYTGETNHDLREFIFKSLKEKFEIEKENSDMDKKCINRANVYKTMTDDQKIVMQDAIANAVESAIKDCRMEYEKTLKTLRLKIENSNGLINKFYGENGMLSKLNKLKDSLEVQKIIINEPAMIVFWKDGTKTVVTATDEAFDEEKGLAMAYAKKWLGNNYAAGGRFKAKLKHAERVKRKEETVENDISKIPICKEIMDEAMRRVKAEMEADAAKEPTEKPTAKKATTRKAKK